MKDSPAIVVHAHEDYKKLLEVLKLGRMAGALLGQQLFRLYANGDWQKAIGQEISWEEFLMMPEVNLDKREATRAMEIYEEFCVKRGHSTEMLAEAGVKNLHRLLPMVKRGQLEDGQIGELLKAGAALPQKSFKETLYDAKNPGGTRTYRFEIFRRCNETNNLQKVHDIESEKIVEAFPHLNEMLMPEII